MSCVSEGGAQAPYGAIQFDFGKAQAIIDQIDVLSAVLVQQRHDRDANSRTMLTTWTGRYADEYAKDLLTMGRDFEDLQGKLRRLRDKVSAAIDAANRERRCRDGANANYQQQHQPVAR